jgi:hypothetical protein
MKRNRKLEAELTKKTKDSNSFRMTVELLNATFLHLK